MTRLGISVAMATFNGARFLGVQLESIVTQSRPPDEIVVCDDGSSDDTGQIVREFSSRTSIPIQFVINEANLGSTRNFEKAVGMCKGPIVALADQDDVWYGQKLERIERTFLESPAVTAVFSDADLIDENSVSMKSRLWPTFSFGLAEQKKFANGDALGVLIRHPVVTGATMGFRRELFGLMTPIPANEIHDQWMSFLLAAMGRFEMIPEPLMQYRRHRGQQVGPGPLNVRDQMAEARDRGEGFYLHEIERFRQFYDWLEKRKASFPNAEKTQTEIRRKLLHLEHRAHLSRQKAARIPKMVREVLSGNYWRYSGGWISIAKDLMIR